jgi:ABC-type Fe3+/spermidine/putrescine transport system ATPase subunit
LDAKVRNDLRYEIRRMTKDLGLTAIHVTHDQAEAMAISDRIAVMKKGKIKQVGKPSELYMSPQNVFVANFIGESNFLEGYVADRSNKDLVIELHGGNRVKTTRNSANKGERIVLAVRPEAFVFEEEPSKTKNCIAGVVERVTFEGTNIRYEIMLENQDRIVIVKPSMAEKWMNVGEKIFVSFPAENVHVFPYPEPSLKEELAVE